jgi:hypothetical protein
MGAGRFLRLGGDLVTDPTIDAGRLARLQRIADYDPARAYAGRGDARIESPPVDTLVAVERAENRSDTALHDAAAYWAGYALYRHGLER